MARVLCPPTALRPMARATGGPLPFARAPIRRIRPNACCKMSGITNASAATELRTLDGQPVRVLHPGFWNHEAGPDFRGAVLQFGQDEPRSGDIEIDLLPQNWQAHQPRAQSGLCQVSFCTSFGPAAPPHPPRRRPWRWKNSSTCPWPRCKVGPERRLRALAGKFARRLFRPAGTIAPGTEGRSVAAGRAGSFSAQSRRIGASRPARRLGTGLVGGPFPRPRLQTKCLGHATRRRGAAPPARRSRFLAGVAGALARRQRLFERRPAGRRQRTGRVFARRCGTTGGASASASATCCCPKNLWRMHGLRPANQPQRRLAMAAHWLASAGFRCQN